MILSIIFNANEALHIYHYGKTGKSKTNNRIIKFRSHTAELIFINTCELNN